MKSICSYVLFFLMSVDSVAFPLEEIERNVSTTTALTDEGEISNKRIQLDQFLQFLNSELERDPNSAVLSYLKGQTILSYIYLIPPPYSKDDFAYIHKIKSDALVWMVNASKLNNNDLTVPQLYVLRRFNSELAVYATDEIIEKDERLRGEDKKVVELKRSKIVALIKLSRFEEAESEAKTLHEKYPDRFKLTSVAYYNEEIAESKSKQKSTEEKEANKPVEKPEEKPIENEVVAANTTVNEEIKPNVLTEESSPSLIQFKSVLEQYGIFILAFFVFLGMYFFSNRKSKK
jgi:hypothetical protein